MPATKPKTKIAPSRHPKWKPDPTQTIQQVEIAVIRQTADALRILTDCMIARIRVGSPIEPGELKANIRPLRPSQGLKTKTITHIYIGQGLTEILRGDSLGGATLAIQPRKGHK